MGVLNSRPRDSEQHSPEAAVTGSANLATVCGVRAREWTGRRRADCSSLSGAADELAPHSDAGSCVFPGLQLNSTQGPESCV